MSAATRAFDSIRPGDALPELAGGGATPQLARLGAEMARSGPQELA